MATANIEKIKVGVSRCLLGERVRFDSGHKKNTYINNTLEDYFEFLPFCPEIEIGLGVPREPIRLVQIDDQIRCVGTKTPELDVTEQLVEIADKQKNWHQQLCGYILKKDSPSCGMERVRLYKNAMPERQGVGLYAQRLMKNFPDLPVEEEGRLGDSGLRENFIQRVYIFSRWKQLNQNELSLKQLQTFHAKHKYTFMSHNQNETRALGAWLATQDNLNLEQTFADYLAKMMPILKQVASRKNHTNTLQHIQGYLKKYIDSDDRQELAETIHQYRQGLLPLIVPITLLRHHFRKYPNEYITQSYYLRPHPGELMLLNNL